MRCNCHHRKGAPAPHHTALRLGAALSVRPRPNRAPVPSAAPVPELRPAPTSQCRPCNAPRHAASARLQQAHLRLAPHPSRPAWTRFITLSLRCGANSCCRACIRWDKHLPHRRRRHGATLTKAVGYDKIIKVWSALFRKYRTETYRSLRYISPWVPPVYTDHPSPPDKCCKCVDLSYVGVNMVAFGEIAFWLARFSTIAMRLLG